MSEPRSSHPSPAQRSTQPEVAPLPDVEEDDLGEAWCVTPTEACTFVALAVFAEKKDAEAFVAILRKRRKASNTYDDLAVLPARARVLVANSYDVTAGRKALAETKL